MSETNERYTNVYKDAIYFIDALAKDYGLKSDIFDMLRKGSSNIEIKKSVTKRSIDENWVNAVEACLPALDYVIRNPANEIEEQERVLNIEFSKHINERSIRHLAQHTNNIASFDGDTITPSKVLNVFYEETKNTYENRFVNTLIQRLYIFVNKRYTEIKDGKASQSVASMDFEAEIVSKNTTGKFKFGIELKNQFKDKPLKIDSNADSDDEADSEGNTGDLWERVNKINSIVIAYLNSEFSKSLGNNFIRPPVMHTNAITKNKYLSQCLELWQYIESYTSIGYQIDVEQSAEKPDQEYIEELYSMMALQYAIFQHNISADIEDEKVLQKIVNDEPIVPEVITELEDVDENEYNVYDTVTRKLVPISKAGRKRLTDSEKKIYSEIEIALEAERRLNTVRARQSRERMLETVERRRKWQRKHPVR